jgi:hypothetical protein
MPFIYKLGTIQMMQQPDRITILYGGYNNEVRRVRLNEPHPSPAKPSWYGDSVGHYEGDTLVIDTVAVKTCRKYAMIDLFGEAQCCARAWPTMFTTSTRRFSAAKGSLVFRRRDLP